VSGVTESAAVLVPGGPRVPVGPDGLTLGRAADNDLALDGERVSRRHARIEFRNGGFAIRDLGSRHGTAVNGAAVGELPVALSPGDLIELGGERLRFLIGEGTRMASQELPATRVQSVRVDGDRLTIGRDPANDLVLDDPNVSRFHAELTRGDGGAEVVDLGSRNGTRIDGSPLERARLSPGATIGIGPYRLVFDGAGITAVSEQGALQLRASAVGALAGEKRILWPTTLALGPGELVAIIGESGAGKSTLLKLLAGVDEPSEGELTVNGEPLAARLTDVGYVPQDEIVHGLLSVREALTYAARLRLPEDAAGDEIEAAVQRVLEELALTEHADTRIAALSGGQRRRAAVASELLGRPGLLFLDEPTTGMDPGLETKMMELFRVLADRSRGVALVTHATKNLALCDRVAVMARGGRLAFDGPPAEALAFFGVADYDGIYTALEEAPPDRWAQPAEEAKPTEAGGRPRGEPRGRGGLVRQTAVLTSRYAKLLLRDRRNLALLVGQAPVLALAGVGLFHTGIFDRPGGSPPEAIQLLFLAAITVIWLGSIDAAREIVKERALSERESAVGIRLPAYLASKLIVLFALVTVQTVLYAGLLLAFRPLDAGTGSWLAVFALLLMTGFAAVGMGLLISALVKTGDQAMSVVPLAVIPQLLFAGAIVPVERMAEPAQTLSYAIFSQWSLAALGTAVDMNERIAEAGPNAAAEFGESFFDVGLATGLLVLAGFLVVFVAALAWLLSPPRRA
jgi:ABC-type multidrug transport system ATPase subunit/pSer/pThr/pTyr-binding forkhead associated (FHA) protein